MPAHRSRPVVLRTAVAAAAVLVAGTAYTLAGTGAVAEPLPSEIGPCAGPDCPDDYPDDNNNLDPIGYDDSVNVFVGGDFDVTGSAAESEGRNVVIGDFDQNKTSGGAVYNVGIAGVGSRVPPPDGSDYLDVGGNLTVAPEQRLLAEEGEHSGVVRVAGTATGTVSPEAVIDATAVDEYEGLRDDLSAASHCYAYPEDGVRRTVTGTVDNQGYQTVFSGDGTSALQVFAVDEDLAATGGGQQSLTFVGIPDDATVLVNLYGAARTLDINSGPQIGLRERLLWNFPDATEVNLYGTTQFQGSILAGEQSSTTELTMAGTNGRLLLTGDLIHGSSSRAGSGQEIHSYPFDGDLPDCADVHPTTSPITPDSTTDGPTADDSTTDEPTTDEPTTDEPATGTATSSAPTTRPGGTTEPAPDETDPVGLPTTGHRSFIAFAAGLAMLACGSIAAMAFRRRAAD